jgi:hypothetical protein
MEIGECSVNHDDNGLPSSIEGVDDLLYKVMSGQYLGIDDYEALAARYGRGPAQAMIERIEWESGRGPRRRRPAPRSRGLFGGRPIHQSAGLPFAGTVMRARRWQRQGISLPEPEDVQRLAARMGRKAAARLERDLRRAGRRSGRRGWGL